MVEKEKKIVVMTELPKQEVTQIIDKEGQEYDVITIETALTMLIEDIKSIKKSLL
jgi:hypothetical protein